MPLNPKVTGMDHEKALMKMAEVTKMQPIRFAFDTSHPTLDIPLVKISLATRSMH
jgi:hypothetical protein